MGLHRALLTAGCGAALVASACGSPGDAGDPVVHPTPTPRPPKVDPSAGAPELLVSVAERVVLLDGAGRVSRVAPRAVHGVPCHGTDLFLNAGAFTGRAEVRSISGTLRWRRPMPVTEVHASACLDSGRAAAVVTAPFTKPRRDLRLVSPGRSVRVRRFRGEVPLLTATQMFVTDHRGIRIYETRSGRPLATIPAPAAIHRIHPSPGGRHLALVTLPPSDTEDHHYVLDRETGRFEEIEIPRLRLFGWVTPDRLAVRVKRKLVLLDPELDVAETIRGFRPTEAIVHRSAVMGLDGRALISASPGDPRARRVGRVPPRTRLVSGLE